MIGKILAERYEIIEKIGGGGMAIVYKAKDRVLNRFVAIKVLRSEFKEDDDFIKRFEREAQSAAALSHSNIVSIHDVGVSEDTYFIVMEYIKGGTLKELIRDKGALNIEIATSYAIQICSAIECAHNNSIIHRDIKSHNIMIKDEGNIKVTDFGIARAATSSTLTNTGNLIGSVHYFSPEQAKGIHSDEKSDIYSFGIVFYEMVTGRLPFEGDTPVAVALKQIQEDPILPSIINKLVPRSIESIILKCMEKDPRYRYEDSEEIIKDLKQSLIMPNGDYVKKKRNDFEETIIITKKDVNDEVEKNASTNNMDQEMYKNKTDNRTGNAMNHNRPGNKPKKNKKTLYIAIVAWLAALVIITLSGYLILNKVFSVDSVIVPSVVGLTESEARNILSEKGFEMEVTGNVTNAEIPEGSVIDQDPKANDTNKLLNPVKVTISKGAPKVKVPNLINTNYVDIDLKLRNIGLVEGVMSSEYSNLPKGNVIKQKIESNTEVDQGTAIDYTISLGPEKITLENYIGLNLETVKDSLKNSDLILGDIKLENSNDYPKDIVIEQSIKAGTEISRKSIVNFVVSLGPSSDATGSSYNLKIELPNNTDAMKVTVFSRQNGKQEKIFDENHSFSESPLTISVTGTGLVFFDVYINDLLYKTRSYQFK